MARAGDIIAAIATGAGSAAIGVVRLSGRGAHALVLRLCPALKQFPQARRMTRVRLVDPVSGRPLDDAMAVLFCAGASYTGEESAELHCHGGRAVLEGVLRACVAAGARPAAPGEFTRRALSAGRMDLAQAEAVALLAEATTEAAVAFGLDALSGRPSAEVVALADRLANCLADCEAALDFSDEASADAGMDGLRPALVDAAGLTSRWLESARAARPALTAFRVALTGAPNAGKSSLFNALLGRPRAIVHPDPGTTRDVVGETVVLRGATCLLMDTAGLREASSPVEADGVARAVAAACDADCTILVVDGTSRCPPPPVGAQLVAVTKADLPGARPPPGLPDGARVIVTSAVDGRGVAELSDAVGEAASTSASAGRVAGCVVAGERQERAVSEARSRLLSAIREIDEGGPAEAVASDLRAAVERLFEVTGRTVTEDVLDRVFRRFCVGK